jgi:hypothetical protein
MPIWIWIVFTGIVISAIMTIYTAKQDRKKEQEWIELEGEKFMELIKADQEKREMDIQ